MFELSREEIVDGSISRALVVLATPIIVQNLTQIAQQVIDIFWLGRLGSDAVAAVGLTLPIVSIAIVLVSLVPYVGTQVIASQRIGADDQSDARRIVVHGIATGLGLGLLATAVFATGADTAVALLGAAPTIAPMAATYLAIRAFSFPFAAVSDAIEAGFVGWGDSRASLYVNVTSVGVNVVLDPILIFGWGPIPRMEVMGAALATVIGVGCGMLLALVLALGPRDSLGLSRRDIDLSLDEFRELFDVGGPATGQRVSQDVVRVVLIGLVSTVGGPAAVAAYTIGARIASVAFIPAAGLSNAAQSIVGQNLGAGKAERARQATWIGVALAAGGLVVVGAVQWLLPESIARVFVPTLDGLTLDYTVTYLRILAYGYWAIGMLYLVRAGFNGARRTRTTFGISLLQYWGVRLPIAAVGALVLGYGPVAIFWAVTVSNVAAALGGFLYYRYCTADGMLDRAAQSAAGD